MSGLELVLATGQRATVRALEGDVLRVESDRPLPPGSRVDGRIGAVTIRGKVSGARRGPDGRALVTLRLTDLTRADRAEIEAALLALLAQ